MLSLPSFCLSLLLLSLPSESFAAHQRDYFRGLRHAPRDFRDYPAVARRDASGTIGTGTGTASGVPTGTGSPYLNTSNTYSPDWKSKGMSVGSQSDFVPSTSTVLTTSVSTVTATTTVTVLPAYEVCDVDGVSCSTISTTSTTTICSAVLTGFFTRVTVTDCDQSVTFSTKSSYSMITAAPTAVQARRAEVTGSLQSIVSYFIAPWQSIAANNPSGITIKVCTVSDSGVVTCNDVQEVWVVLTVTVPVVRTSTVTVSQYLPTAAVLVLGQNQNTTVSAGNVDFVTEVLYTTVTVNETTSTSQLSTQTGPTTRTTTLVNTATIPVQIVTLTAPKTSLSTITSTSGTTSFEEVTTITEYETTTMTITLNRALLTEYSFNTTLSYNFTGTAAYPTAPLTTLV